VRQNGLAVIGNARRVELVGGPGTRAAEREHRYSARFCGKSSCGHCDLDHSFCDPSAWGFDPLARGQCRVLFFRAHETLAPAAAPEDLPMEPRFSQRRLSFQLEWTLPTRIRLDDSDLSI